MKLILALSVAALFTVTTPEQAVAGSCTIQYAGCIAEAGLLDEPFRTLADIECGAEYAGCVAGKLAIFF